MSVNGHHRLPDDDTRRPPLGPLRWAERYEPDAQLVLFPGRCEGLLATIPDEAVQLVVTSPPYNIGKAYERRVALDQFIEQQRGAIAQAVRALAAGGSLCWQVGNHVDRGEVVPLDLVLYPLFKEQGLKLRNQIVWHFAHGLHCSKRFSGRYETILWFTKGDDYVFDPDPARVPQKYPNKRYFRGPRKGELSSHPLGANPSDFWRADALAPASEVWDLPNVKWNHVEKTSHPCQFPVELVERLVLALTRPDDRVLDPYGGVGSSVLAALLNGRRGLMAETVPEYRALAAERIRQAERGELRVRPMSRPVYQPPTAEAKPSP